MLPNMRYANALAKHICLSRLHIKTVKTIWIEQLLKEDLLPINANDFEITCPKASMAEVFMCPNAIWPSGV